MLWRAEVKLGVGKGRRILSRATDRGGNVQKKRPEWNWGALNTMDKASRGVSWSLIGRSLMWGLLDSGLILTQMAFGLGSVFLWSKMKIKCTWKNDNLIQKSSQLFSCYPKKPKILRYQGLKFLPFSSLSIFNFQYPSWFSFYIAKYYFDFWAPKIAISIQKSSFTGIIPNSVRMFKTTRQLETMLIEMQKDVFYIW